MEINRSVLQEVYSQLCIKQEILFGIPRTINIYPEIKRARDVVSWLGVNGLWAFYLIIFILCPLILYTSPDPLLLEDIHFIGGAVGIRYPAFRFIYIYL